MSLMTTVGLQFIAHDRSRAGINSFRGSLAMTGRSVRLLGSNLLALAGVGGGFYMLGNMFRSGVTEAAAFEKQMANVSTMLDDQSISIMPRYAQQVRAMSKQFGEGTETLSKGLYDILSASISPARALEVLAVSSKAAKAGITDTGIAADAITTILNSYSLEASRAGDVSDKLFGIVIKGKTTFGELAPNIGKVAALAATAGESFDDLGAVIATMTRAGVQTEIAITSLRAIILSFLKPQSDSIEMARKYGVELNSATLRTIGLTGVIQRLKKATAEELAVIVPTSRAITGFAAAIQKSEGLASDYDFMLNSLGSTEKAYQKIADTSAFKLDQLNQEWIDMKRSIGDLTTGPLIGFLKNVTGVVDQLTQAIENSKKAAQRFNDYVEKHRLAPSKQNYGSWAPMAPVATTEPVMDASNAGRDMKLQLQRQQTLAMIAQIKSGGLSSLKFGGEIKAPPASAGGVPDPAVVSARTNAQMVADTREQLTSIRSMHDKTRMEKIRLLEDYKAAYFGATAEIEAGEKLLNDEILSLQRSRVDAMDVYNAELREDFQYTGLYISEKFAEASRSIESGLSGAFMNLRQEGSNFRSFMVDVFQSIRESFAQMLADMAARVVMNAALSPLMSGLSGVLGSLFGGGPGVQAGAPVGAGGQPFTPSNPYGLKTNPAPVVRHSGWIPDNVPSFHGGRNLKRSEQVAVIEKDELIAPADQVFRSPGRAGSAMPTVIINNNTGKQLEQDGPPQFDGEKWVVGIVASNIAQGGSLSKLMSR